MKIWQVFQQYLSTGQWHIHTNFTDGKNSVFEYAESAVSLNVPLLAFTEHVRTELDYSFDQLLYEIDKARKAFPQLIILSGFEAKVLPDGTLDCRPEILGKVDYRLFAFHSFPSEVETYLYALHKVLYEAPVDAWAHPGLFFEKHTDLHLDDDELKRIFQLLEQREILLENNFKYKLPNKKWIMKYIETTKNNLLISGGDIHSVAELFAMHR